MSTISRRILAGLSGVAMTGAFLATSMLPADATVRTGVDLCSSANTTGTIIVFWNDGHDQSTTLRNGVCHRVHSGEASSTIVEVSGSKFRVGYDGKPYQSWQTIDGQFKVFKPSGTPREQIYFDVRH
jgi:hypothetical protein